MCCKYIAEWINANNMIRHAEMTVLYWDHRDVQQIDLVGV